MITYFVLKATGGKPVGCVRLEDGRARSSCPCTLLLEDGTPLPLGEGETLLPGPALGAAILRGEELQAWGAMPGTKLTGAELLRRLRQKDTPPAIEPTTSVPEPEPEPTPEPDGTPDPETTKESQDVSEDAEETPLGSDGMPDPEATKEPQDVSEDAEETPLGSGGAPDPEATKEPQDVSEDAEETPLGSGVPPDPEDSASLADDFGLLVRHAGEVYEGLLHPPLPEEPEEPAKPSPTPTPEAPRRDWFSETEQLLSRLRRR